MRRRNDSFLDLQLSIRNLGSVDEALQAFVTPEVLPLAFLLYLAPPLSPLQLSLINRSLICSIQYLNGDNQYFCDNCNAKCDAEKGLSLTELPQLLTLQVSSLSTPLTLLPPVPSPSFFSLLMYSSRYYLVEAI